jgi:redox-sensing transcriptional repressor
VASTAPADEEAPIPDARRIPEATVVRLPLYYRALLETADQEIGTVSSERLAELAGVNAAKVRKDLSYLGSYGTRGVGYDVEHLLHEISRELGLTHDWPVAIVGVGNLGHALANYRGFGARGYRIVALVDADPDKVGQTVGDLAIESLDELPTIARARGVAIGIIATPAHAAQEVADRLVDAGVTSILNFAPTVVTAPAGVSLRKVDLAIELQILSFYQQRRDSAPALSGDGRKGEAAPASR